MKKGTLLNGLHRYLIWVGEKVPEDVLVNGENIKLHELSGDAYIKKIFRRMKEIILWAGG